jgi:hypothetical protein
MIVTPLEFFYARRRELLDHMAAQEIGNGEEQGIRDGSGALNAEELALYERLIAEFEGRANCS